MDANGKTTTYQYNAEGQLTNVQGPDGSQQLMVTRDSSGNTTKIEHADGGAYTYTYDSHGNPTSIGEPSGATEKITYDGTGHPATATDGAGAAKQFGFNSSGQLTSETGATGRKTTYGYDGDGNLTSITDGLGDTTRLTYDAFGHQLTATDPLGQTESSTYDEAGRLIKRVDRNGEATTYSYDADGKLVHEAAANGESTVIGYDALEHPTSVANETQSLGFAYDGDGRVISATGSSVGSAPATTLSYTYDADGNRTSMSGPDGTTTYAYDAFSRLSSVSPAGEPGGASFGFGYTPGGELAAVTRPDGIDDALTYNDEQLLSRAASAGSTPVAGFGYTYGSTDLRASATSTEGNTTSYAYDPMGELTKETPSAGTPQGFSYDAAGNRIGGTYDSAEELISDGTATYSYDADGQLTRRTVIATGATTTYDWNSRHELAAVHLPDGSTETLSYDPLGRRVSVTDGAATTSSVYDGVNVHLEYEGSASPAAVYTDGLEPNQLVEMARGGHRYSYLVDGQGSTIALADEHGNVVQRYSYDAFGNPSVSGSLTNPFTYTGQAWDPISGLYYYKARYYDPTLGRFISRDPVLHANPYPYVENDPANVSDPTGAQGIPEEEAEIADEGILEGIEGASVEGELDAFARTEGQSLDNLIQGAKEARANYSTEIGDAAEAQTKAANFVAKLNDAEKVARTLDPAQAELPFTEGVDLLRKGLVVIGGLSALGDALYEGLNEAFGE